MSDPHAPSSAPRRAGRYTLHAEIASGGMATVHYGQMLGAHGFSRVVAIKRMLPRLAHDASFHAMFVDEARLASRVQHPNVVPILDVVDEHGDVMIVMEYVRGPSLSALLRASVGAETPVPVAIAANIGCAMLAGLHAAHEARDRQGRTLGIVHRDVSPQNVLVGVDGVTRIMDFGIAKASHRLNATHDRQLKGKLCYMAPEQFQNTGVDRRTDVFATAVVLWGMLAGRRLFRGGDVTETMTEVLRCDVPALAPIRGDVPPELEAAIRGALDPDREGRPATAEIFAAAIEAATPAASNRAVAEWVSQLAGSTVTERDAVIVDIEKTNSAMAFPIASGSAAQSPGNLATADITGSKAVTADWVRDAHGEATPQPTLETTTRVEGRRDAVTVVAGPTDGGAIRATVEPRKATRSRIAWGLGVLALAAAGTVALVMGRDSTPGGTETISPTTGAEPSVVASESVSPSVPSSLPNVTSAAAASATPSSSAAAIAAPTPDRGTGASRPARPPPPAASAKAPPPGPRGPYYPPSPFPK